MLKLSKKSRKNIVVATYLTIQTLKLLFFAAGVLFLLWCAWSFIEVQIHNWTMLSDNPYEYCSFNLFSLMTKWS